MSIKDLFNILMSDEPSIELLIHEEELFELIPELRKCKGFNQNNKWHVYDVYNHILHVVDNVPKDTVLRLSALFHDVGKPISYYEDENKVGHFKGHWVESKKIFDAFAKKYNLDQSISCLVSELILYHDVRIPEMNGDSIKNLYNILGDEGIIRLYQFKKADLLAQNSEYYYLLDTYEQEKNKILAKNFQMTN